MLSTVVGGVAFIPATLAIYLYKKQVPFPIVFVLGHIAASGFAVALAASDTFAHRSTFLLGKRPSGKIAWWGWTVFWPYHLSLQAKLWLQRQYSKEPVYNHIAEGWYLGGWLADRKLAPATAPAYLDCTCELPRKVPDLPYHNLPVWDTHGPTIKQIDEGVKWALQQRESTGSVYIGCAHGHGRSLVLMCASLVMSGQARDFLEAYKMVKAARPRVRLNSRQHKALVMWQEHMNDRKKS